VPARPARRAACAGVTRSPGLVADAGDGVPPSSCGDPPSDPSGWFPNGACSSYRWYGADSVRRDNSTDSSGTVLSQHDTDGTEHLSIGFPNVSAEAGHASRVLRTPADVDAVMSDPGRLYPAELSLYFTHALRVQFGATDPGLDFEIPWRAFARYRYAADAAEERSASAAVNYEWNQNCIVVESSRDGTSARRTIYNRDECARNCLRTFTPTREVEESGWYCPACSPDNSVLTDPAHLSNQQSRDFCLQNSTANCDAKCNGRLCTFARPHPKLSSVYECASKSDDGKVQSCSACCTATQMKPFIVPLPQPHTPVCLWELSEAASCDDREEGDATHTGPRTRLGVGGRVFSSPPRRGALDWGGLQNAGMPCGAHCLSQWENFGLKWEKVREITWPDMRHLWPNWQSILRWAPDEGNNGQETPSGDPPSTRHYFDRKVGTGPFAGLNGTLLWDRYLGEGVESACKSSSGSSDCKQCVRYAKYLPIHRLVTALRGRLVNGSNATSTITFTRQEFDAFGFCKFMPLDEREPALPLSSSGSGRTVERSDSELPFCRCHDLLDEHLVLVHLGGDSPQHFGSALSGVIFRPAAPEPCSFCGTGTCCFQDIIWDQTQSFNNRGHFGWMRRAKFQPAYGGGVCRFGTAPAAGIWPEFPLAYGNASDITGTLSFCAPSPDAAHPSVSAPTYAGSGALHIGNGRFGAGSSMQIDDVRVFARALPRSEVREFLALNVGSENNDTRSGLAVLLRFHIQAPWNWTEYAVDRQAFALPSTTVLMDDSGLNNHGIMVGSGWRLQVPC